MSDYHYDKFTADAYDLDNFIGPKVGTRAPEATVTLMDGSNHHILDFDGDFLVLELGSITCPLFQSRRNRMSDFVRENPETNFAILYVREAHPGVLLNQHRNFDDKRQMAGKLQDEDGEQRPIYLDDINGTAHKAYGSFPNSVFIINKNGCVVYRADWNNPGATERALSRLKAGKSAGGQGLFLPAKPPVAISILKRAGKDALVDFLKSLPKLIWKNVIKRNLRMLFGRNPDILPDHIC